MRKAIFSGGLVLAFCLFVCLAESAATDISGTIATTLVITEDSQLVGNVSCTVVAAPCIEFGTDDIELRLAGFVLTGQANGVKGCNLGGPVLGEDGINTNGHSDVKILGPGIVRRFRNHGIHVEDSRHVIVRGVVASTNCHNGIEVGGERNIVEDSVTVRNSSIATLPCGGIEVPGNRNVIRRNEVSGNGLFFPAPLFPQDFGIGVFGKENLIEQNGVGGNSTHGINLASGATGNIVRRNQALGNNPIQVSIDHSFGIVDIFDFNSAGTNTFENNLCENSGGGAAGICSSLPMFAGHRNVRAEDDKNRE